MCITRYHISRWGLKVKVVIVDKETERSIYINGRRRAKRGQRDNYYNTFIEAKEAIVLSAINNVNECHAGLAKARTFLHKAQAIKHDPHTH